MLKDLFLLDPDVVFLNHGSFGACPIPVFETYQEWQRLLEYQPVNFLGRQLSSLLLESRQALGKYIHVNADDLVFIPNATYGVNLLARSLDLHPGDEVLTSDHEYGACDYTWEFNCQKTGAQYIHQSIPLPISSAEEIVDQFWRGVSTRTKVIFLSHITSPTALHLPIEAICKRARVAGILTIMDGAHAPGQIDLDMEAIGADFYVGNCHKWMLSPKGAGFLYTRPEKQPLVEPLIVSWGYKASQEISSGSRFLDFLQWTGTRDPAAFLSVPRAIQFMEEQHWKQVRHQCHDQLKGAIQRICDLVNLPPPYPLDSHLYHQMGIAPLPPGTNLIALKQSLYEQYKIEVPLTQWHDMPFIRISIQGYNSPSDIRHLIEALEILTPSRVD